MKAMGTEIFILPLLQFRALVMLSRASNSIRMGRGVQRKLLTSMGLLRDVNPVIERKNSPAGK